MNKYLVIPLLVTASLPIAGVAEPVDNYAAQDIVSARYATAIARLEADFARNRSDESTLLNLALAYRQAGRAADAQRLYRQVLSMKNYELDSVNGQVVWAHDVARRGLAKQIALNAR